MERPLNVLLIAAEVTPFAKVGGLADVAGALPKALRKLGHDVRIILPKYRQVDEGKYGLTDALGEFQVPFGATGEPVKVKATTSGQSVPVYFVQNSRYFDRENVYGYPDDAERFIFFCRAAAEVPRRLGWQPDVIHCNDWHTAIIPAWLKTIYKQDPFYARCATVFTVHNLAYQGVFDERYLALTGIEPAVYRSLVPLYIQGLNLMSLALRCSDVVNTVSENYAREILTPEYGEGLQQILQDQRERLFGIVNGIDYDEWNPATDPHIAAKYDVSSIEKKVENKLALQRERGLAVDPEVPLLGTVSRLADQKGFDLVASAIDPMMKELGMQFIVLGTGEPKYHDLFRDIGNRYPARAAIVIGFDPVLAQKIYAGADMFLMPSRFEPCGLGQLISFRYGTIPVVRRTGGLADTVQDFDPRTGRGNGFVFEHYNDRALLVAVTRAIESYKHRDTWQGLVKAGMVADYSWAASARKYADLYAHALTLKEQHAATT
ncbi:MAG: glycogen synthase GlgA [Chloroflexi bacterium]|nr:glycogen synthase GlgA [Chloroflexota bacterium]